MSADNNLTLPSSYSRLLAESQRLEFPMNSDIDTGALLRVLAASKPAGRLLELGTGCGLGTCWLLDGMTNDASLISIDTDDRYQSVARDELGADGRLSLVLGDAGGYLDTAKTSFDLIYADAWPGKYSHRQRALDLLSRGGIYVVDDMLPQPNWPADHAPKAGQLLAELQDLPGFASAFLAWSTGIVICVKQ